MNYRKTQVIDDTEHASLMVARAWSSAQLKTQQAEIKRCITTMQKQLTAFSPVVSIDETEAIKKAIATFNRLAKIVEHAKEKKKRIEKFSDDVKKSACLLLKRKTAAMTLENKILLIVQRDFGRNDYASLLENLKKGGISVLRNVVESDVNWWCVAAADSVANSTREKHPTITTLELEVEVQRQTDRQQSRSSPLPASLIEGLLEGGVAENFIKTVKDKLTT